MIETLGPTGMEKPHESSEPSASADSLFDLLRARPEEKARIKRMQREAARFRKRVAKVDAMIDTKRGTRPSNELLKGGLSGELLGRKEADGEVKHTGRPVTVVEGGRLRSSALDGKPIQVLFGIPLDETQKREIGERLRPLLSGKESRIRFAGDMVVVEGLMVRDSKPVRDTLVRYREFVSPKPIRLRRSSD